jgi:hypothetical protein
MFCGDTNFAAASSSEQWMAQFMRARFRGKLVFSSSEVDSIFIQETILSLQYTTNKYVEILEYTPVHVLIPAGSQNNALKVDET